THGAARRKAKHLQSESLGMAVSTARGGDPLIGYQILPPLRGADAASACAGAVAVTEEVLQRAGIDVVIGQFKAAAMAQHVRMNWEGNYTHRSMTRRTRIEYSTTHTMSEAQPRLSSTACSLMVGSPWDRKPKSF